ncbi:MAG: tetratricopeptide repeat protein, partial [Planctomycetota bacterium]|nr:tetratricopeptide repeat protein [Planctomycetota bacterium]
MPDGEHIWRFSPGQTRPETLEAIFVQRHALADELVSRIRESVLTPDKHHSLLVGARGLGKTHLVALVRHRVAADDELRDRLRIAWLNEDESCASFLELLLRILRALAAAYPGEFSAARLNDVFEAGAVGPEHARDVAVRLLLEQLGGRALLVIVENLDELFSGLGDAGQKEWRAFLQQYPVSTLLATAQGLFAGVSRRNSPFFGTFQIEHLKPLTVLEAAELLRSIAQAQQAHARDAGDAEAARTAAELAAFLSTPQGRARVRALHHLSGGNHRIYIVLSEFATRDTLDELLTPFERLLDELTPYYQERLRWLSAQQRRLVEQLCAATQPLPVKELSRQLFITEQTAAGQLKKLRELGYVTSQSRGRESLYELTEPLMRLSFELKEQRRGPLRLIVDFLRVWYRSDELTERLSRLPGTSQRSRQYMEAALLAAETSEDPRLAPIRAAIEAAEAAGQLDEAIAAREELAHTRGTALDWFELGYWQAQTRHFDAALASYDRALELDPKYAFAWNNRGIALRNLGRFEESLASYDRALELDPERSVAWNNRGIAIRDLGRFEESLASYDRALELDPKYVLAWNNRGIALRKLGRFEESLASCDRALELAPEHAFAWNNRGSALQNVGRLEESLASYDRALELDPDYAHAAFNRVEPLFQLGRWAAGFDALDRALETHWPNKWNYSGDVSSMIGTIASSGTQPAVWRERVGRLVSAYQTAGIAAR